MKITRRHFSGLAAMLVLRNGLTILGITAPTRMIRTAEQGVAW